jgi:hypothetical protein
VTVCRSCGVDRIPAFSDRELCRACAPPVRPVAQAKRPKAFRLADRPAAPDLGVYDRARGRAAQEMDW